MTRNIKRIIIGISGSSGSILGIRILEMLRSSDIETHLIMSQAAMLTIREETDWGIEQVNSLADVVHPITDIGASLASGSFTTIGMIVVPCSIKTLSAIANSYADNLLTRAADVTLKEGRPLILVVRETPIHFGHIRLMELASQAGAIIYLPVPSFYSRPQTVDSIIDNIAGRILARMGIVNDHYHVWNGDLSNPDD
jgi:4-hydroxy-3-polyprenylbenzoate decarboxylase